MTPSRPLTRKGMGQLIELGIQRGRKTQKDLKVGICGEHGGEAKSVEFCHKGRDELCVLLTV